MTDVIRENLATDETVSLISSQKVELISSQKVEGTAVFNRLGEKLGTIDHLMINKLSGQVAYAVMSFGGFLGLGESYHPLPWKVLDYDTSLGGYRVDTDRQRLEAAPYYSGSNEPDWSPSYTGRIDEYWIQRP